MCELVFGEFMNKFFFRFVVVDVVVVSFAFFISALYFRLFLLLFGCYYYYYYYFAKQLFWAFLSEVENCIQGSQFRFKKKTFSLLLLLLARVAFSHALNVY